MGTNDQRQIKAAGAYFDLMAMKCLTPPTARQEQHKEAYENRRKN